MGTNLTDSVKTAHTSHPYQAKLDFDSTHTRIAAAVRPGARVLDIGCSDGYLAGALKKKGCYIAGIDLNPGTVDENLDEFHLADLNEAQFPVDPATFDSILMLDVIEHLNEPEAFADRLRNALGNSRSTEVIATTGNVAFISVRMGLLFGNFDYAERGILDRTHTRLFTFASFRKLMEDAGFDVLDIQGIPAPFPLVLGHNALAGFMLALNRLLIRLSRGLFSFQILYRLRVK